MILRTLEERMGLIGRLVMRIIGIAWALACYFVVPVLAFEDLTPIAAIQALFEALPRYLGRKSETRQGHGTSHVQERVLACFIGMARPRRGVTYLLLQRRPGHRTF
jgi:hypothetical protein